MSETESFLRKELEDANRNLNAAERVEADLQTRLDQSCGLLRKAWGCLHRSTHETERGLAAEINKWLRDDAAEHG